jgi:tetratricopeptide (TPR) repeat protein
VEAGEMPEWHYVQNVTAVGGFAYGVVGADIHVFESGLPLYLLANWPGKLEADRGWLRKLPSRMLNSRRAVVPFTGRDSDLADLRVWRDSGPRLTVRWLHGPGGQGKTRLADQFAAESLQAGWKVIAAFHGPDADQPKAGSQDMSLDGVAGLLMVVDYADRWPLTHLTWLLKNVLLHQAGVVTRILMVARTTDSWPAVCGVLDTYQADTSSHLLEPLTQASGERSRMFSVAADSFAAVYEMPGASGPREPAGLPGSEFGLVLAIHVAALVGVDAKVNGLRPPTTMAGLTSYLLNRERLHWARLYDGTSPSGTGRNTYRTAPDVMNQAVFTASLTGSMPTFAGQAVLEDLRLPEPAQVLADHAACYPPDNGQGTVLEPLYPDRLAEDFLALTMPGHDTDYPAQPWASATAGRLLEQVGDATAAPGWIPRAVTFLTAAAERWPHLRMGYLYPLLRNDPQLAVDAGSAVLSSLANLADAPTELFEAIEPCMPARRDVDLDVGVAAVVQRLTAHRLAVTRDPTEQVKLYMVLARHQRRAGLRIEALSSGREAVRISQLLAESEPGAHEHMLADALAQLSTYCAEIGLRSEALDTAMQATVMWKRLADVDPHSYGSGLASALQDLGAALGDAGQPKQAQAAAEKATQIWRRLAQADPVAYEHQLAGSLINLGSYLAKAGHFAPGAACTTEALEIYQRLAVESPAVFEPDVALALNNLSGHVAELGESERSLAAAKEAVKIRRRLAKVNPGSFEPGLSSSLSKLASSLSDLGRDEEALAAEQEALELNRRLSSAMPAAYEQDVAFSLHNVAFYLGNLDRYEDALAANREAARIWRKLAQGDSAAFEYRLAHALSSLAADLSELGRNAEALETSEESVRILRRLADEDPEVHSARLAMSLANLGGYLALQGHPEQGLGITQEAVDIYRALAETYPAAHNPAYGLALSKLGIRYSQLKRHQEAVSALHQAVTIHRHLASQNPAVFGPQLAHMLLDLSAELDKTGRQAEAADIRNEAATLAHR